MDLRRLSLFHAKATFAVTLQMAGLAANTLTLREENDEKLFSAASS